MRNVGTVPTADTEFQMQLGAGKEGTSALARATCQRRARQAGLAFTLSPPRSVAQSPRPLRSPARKCPCPHGGPLPWTVQIQNSPKAQAETPCLGTTLPRLSLRSDRAFEGQILTPKVATSGPVPYRAVCKVISPQRRGQGLTYGPEKPPSDIHSFF